MINIEGQSHNTSGMIYFIFPQIINWKSRAKEKSSCPKISRKSEINPNQSSTFLSPSRHLISPTLLSQIRTTINSSTLQWLRSRILKQQTVSDIYLFIYYLYSLTFRTLFWTSILTWLRWFVVLRLEALCACEGNSNCYLCWLLLSKASMRF
jgi:hypothetical protein